MNPGHSSWPPRFGSAGHTSGLIGDVCQAGQAACQFSQPAIGEQLVDGGGFRRHCPCGDHGHRPEQSTAAGTDRGQDLTRRLPTNGLRVEEGGYQEHHNRLETLSSHKYFKKAQDKTKSPLTIQYFPVVLL